MFNELPGVILMFLLMIVIAFPLGKYLSKVFSGERTALDFMYPLEKLFWKICGINAEKEMSWQESMKAMLTINLIWFLLAMAILMNQSVLPLNPDHNPSMSADLAFNTAISFLVNCNLQHYSGETGVSYFSQLFALMFLQFVSAATGIAAAVIVITALRERTTKILGNFYNYFTKAVTRLLLPLCIIISIMLLANGMPMTFSGKDTIHTLQGDTVQVSTGPVAAFVPIKHLGTNGGGWFGTNSAHPFENPNYLTNIIEMLAQIIIPIAMVFAMGFYLRKPRFAWSVFLVMTIGFLLLVVPTIFMEMNGNSSIGAMGIDMKHGAMEGKEVRFGAAASGYWSILTTVTSTGSVNSLHDSFMPLSGMNQMLAMMVNAFYGGDGVGILNYYIFIIIAVFISGLMVGRTPEFMGKKIEAGEMKIAVIVTLVSALFIKGGTALACYLITKHPSLPWLNNPGYHGFSEMLYEYTSASANNGSGFEGLGDNNPFWNISTGIILLLSRFISIIGPVAIAGRLAEKKYIPESAGTLRTDTATFGMMTFAVIAIVTALSFFPALALGPMAEYFSMH